MDILNSICSSMTPEDCGNYINFLSMVISTLALIVVSVVALFQMQIHSIFWRPNLQIKIITEPPDCHKTEYHTTAIEYVQITKSDKKRQDKKSVEAFPQRVHKETDAYYFRMRIENKGNVKAENVEVFASRLLVKSADGSSKQVKAFLPMNLNWSHHASTTFLPAISPGTYKHCDLAHIINPNNRSEFSNEDKNGTDVDAKKTLLSFDTVVKAYTKNHLVDPGTYYLDITVAASNTQPVTKTLEITLKGEWFDDEQKMLTGGIGIKIL